MTKEIKVLTEELKRRGAIFHIEQLEKDDETEKKFYLKNFCNKNKCGYCIFDLNISECKLSSKNGATPNTPEKINKWAGPHLISTSNAIKIIIKEAENEIPFCITQRDINKARNTGATKKTEKELKSHAEKETIKMILQGRASFNCDYYDILQRLEYKKIITFGYVNVKYPYYQISSIDKKEAIRNDEKKSEDLDGSEKEYLNAIINNNINLLFVYHKTAVQESLFKKELICTSNGNEKLTRKGWLNIINRPPAGESIDYWTVKILQKELKTWTKQDPTNGRTFFAGLVNKINNDLQGKWFENPINQAEDIEVITEIIGHCRFFEYVFDEIMDLKERMGEAV